MSSEIKLADPDFDKSAFIKNLESVNYLMLAIPLGLFGWVFLEKERNGGLRNDIWNEPDLMFHVAMLVGVGYVLNRTLISWKGSLLKGLDGTPELDLKLKKSRKSIVWRNVLWIMGAAISTYGLYEKGDMFYTLFFTVFLVLITANRPSGRYFSKLFKLKGDEKKWMEAQ